MSPVTVDAVRAIVAAVPDPELPVLTIDDLGVLREVRVDDDGHVEVDITPTYSGCPAMDAIRADVERRLNDVGMADVVVRLVLAPAWSTDEISESGRRKLLHFGIAPPTGRAALVDFSQIAVARDLAPSVTVLDQTFGDYDQQAIRVVARYDAAPLNAQAVVALSGITI